MKTVNFFRVIIMLFLGASMAQAQEIPFNKVIDDMLGISIQEFEREANRVGLSYYWTGGKKYANVKSEDASTIIKFQFSFDDNEMNVFNVNMEDKTDSMKIIKMFAAFESALKFDVAGGNSDFVISRETSADANYKNLEFKSISENRLYTISYSLFDAHPKLTIFVYKLKG